MPKHYIVFCLGIFSRIQTHVKHSHLLPFCLAALTRFHFGLIESLRLDYCWTEVVLIISHWKHWCYSTSKTHISEKMQKELGYILYILMSTFACDYRVAVSIVHFSFSLRELFLPPLRTAGRPVAPSLPRWCRTPLLVVEP